MAALGASRQKVHQAHLVLHAGPLFPTLPLRPTIDAPTENLSFDS